MSFRHATPVEKREDVGIEVRENVRVLLRGSHGVHWQAVSA